MVTSDLGRVTTNRETIKRYKLSIVVTSDLGRVTTQAGANVKRLEDKLW